MQKVLQEIAEKALQHHIVIATAESCTGGWIAQQLTELSGSSAWFDRGFVTYSNEAKQQMLGVSAHTLEQHGAVSEAVVREMAEGALANSSANLAIAVSGIAGPTGGTAEKPVGLVWMAWAIKEGRVDAESQIFTGDRAEVRRQAVDYVLRGIAARIS